MSGAEGVREFMGQWEEEAEMYRDQQMYRSTDIYRSTTTEHAQ